MIRFVSACCSSWRSRRIRRSSRASRKAGAMQSIAKPAMLREMNIRLKILSFNPPRLTTTDVVAVGVSQAFFITVTTDRTVIISCTAGDRTRYIVTIESIGCSARASSNRLTSGEKLVPKVSISTVLNMCVILHDCVMCWYVDIVGTGSATSKLRGCSIHPSSVWVD